MGKLLLDLASRILQTKRRMEDAGADDVQADEVTGKRARRAVETFDPSTSPKRVKPEEEYEVEAILDKRVVGTGSSTKTEYLVHWRGYGTDEDTWEPMKELTNVQSKIDEFESGRRGAKKTSAAGVPKTNLPGKNIALLSSLEMRALLSACKQQVTDVGRADMQTQLRGIIREARPPDTVCLIGLGSASNCF